MSKDKVRDVARLLQAAQNMSEKFGWQVRSRIEEMQYHTDLSGDYDDAEVYVTGNWNTVDKWNPETRKSVLLPGGDLPKRLADAFGRISGVGLEWSDQCSTCHYCSKLVRTDPTSYGWLPQYVTNDDGLFCLDCVDPEDHLRDLEGNPRKANTIESIDPADHGYFQLQGDFEHGFHRGQDADPKKIAKSLEDKGISRYLFQIDGQGQFDTRFSVWVHEDERETVEDAGLDGEEPLSEREYNGPSVSGAMERGLREATVAMGKLDGEGIRYTKIGMDESGEPTVEARLVSEQDFIEGKMK